MNSIIQALASHAIDDNFKDKICLGDNKKSITYKEAWDYIYSFAERLKEQGFDNNKYIVVQCTQNVEYMVTALAIQLCGAIFVPVEKGSSDNRILEITEDTKASLYIGLSKPKLAIDFTDINDILDDFCKGSKAPTDLSSVKFPESSDTAEILFSTGTTGKSKGIELSHGNDIALAENVINGVNMKPNNVELIPMPLSHSHGLRRTYANIFNGSTAVFINGVTLIKQLFDMIENYKVTSMDLAPAILTMIFKLSGNKLEEYKDQIDYIQLGSAPLVEEDKAHLSSLLPYTRLYNFYGTTEAGCSCIMDFNEMQGKVGCIGKPAVNAKFIFVDENRNIIQATQENPGFMATAGGQNMKCYFNEPELTAGVVENGYIYTNDLGYEDSEGLIYYIGRKDDVINCGGVKISPDEIEKEVSKNQYIKDCACVPVEDKIQGQAPKLFISLESDSSLPEFDMKEFKKYLRENLDGNKIPKQIEIIDEIPRTYNGKIQRKKLLV